VPLAVPTDPASLGELMEQLPAGDGPGRDFPDLRAVATGPYRPDEEIAEHLPATRSPRFHTATAGAALVWTEYGREVDPEHSWPTWPDWPTSWPGLSPSDATDSGVASLQVD
jgi:hypothetical protein